MKTLLKLSVFASIIILIAISCQKTLLYEDSLSANASKEFNTAFVKEWYNKSFTKSAEFATSNIKENGKKQPDWKNVTYRKVGNIEILEFPLLKEKKTIAVRSDNSLTSTDKKRIALASLKRISFIRAGNNEIIIRELDYVPDWEYLKRKNFDITDVELGKSGNTFTGKIITKKWSGEILSVRLFKEGKITGRVVTKQKGAIIKGNAMLVTPTSSHEECEEYETCVQTEMCEMEWVCSGDNCAYQFVVPDNCYWEEECTTEQECVQVEDEPGCDYGSTESCECQLYGIGCSGGGGGGGGGNNETVIIQSVTNELTDPCQLAAFAAITSEKLKNELTKLYTETFVGNNKVHNLVIGESNFGNPTPGRSLPDPLNSNTWLIDLNNGFEHQLTQELWASVILHELVHGFIKKNALDFSPASTFDGSHQVMLDKWILQISAALKESFGLTDTDAMALSLEGFDDVLKDDVTNQFRADMKTWAQTKYNVDLTVMAQIADDYYTKAKGTACQ